MSDNSATARIPARVADLVWRAIVAIALGLVSGVYAADNPGVAVAAAAPDTWTSVGGKAENAWEPSAVWTGTAMVVWGGHLDGWGASYNVGYTWSPPQGPWKQISNVGAPSGRYGHSAVWTGTQMIVWGGATGSGFANDGARYDPQRDAWSPMARVGAPTPRLNHTAIWTGTEMIVWGGTIQVPGNYQEVADGGRYDPVTDTWSPLATANAPVPAQGRTAVWTGTDMIVWGGQDRSGNYHNDGAVFSPRTGTWSALPTSGAPAPRVAHTAVYSDHEMIVWGGSYQQTANGPAVPLGDGAAFNPLTGSWRTVAQTGAPSPRTGHTSVWTGTEMLTWGGSTVTYGRLGDGARYDPSADRWTAMSDVGALPPRASHVAVWSGAYMLVFGGDATAFDDKALLGAYSPSGDRWIHIDQSLLGPRSRATAVWTGTEMIVWGGLQNESGFALGGGAAYNPTTNTWRRVSHVNEPSPRFAHTAVWTGTEMIIWGGGMPNGPTTHPFLETNTGARYNPLTDTWSPLPLQGAPSPRSGYSAVWTGKEMIVWGGVGYNFTPLGNRLTTDAAAYSPATDSWRPIPMQDAPAPRTGHAAVWTGTEMLIWGGQGDGRAQYGNGARFNPATNIWRPMSSQNAPSSRRDAEVVWTGARMLLWGGLDESGSVLADGAAYDPSTDQWSPISKAGAPSARVGFTATWTGSQLLVWGGVPAPNTYAALGDGAAYVAATDRWVPLTNVGAPGARTDYTAIWTGSEMIVWSGAGRAGGRACYDDGGRYVPPPAPASFTSPSTATFFAGLPGAFAVSAGGQPAPTVRLLSGTLPSGLRFDQASASLSGTPSPGTGGTYTLVFAANNGTPPDTVESFTLTVIEAPGWNVGGGGGGSTSGHRTPGAPVRSTSGGGAGGGVAPAAAVASPQAPLPSATPSGVAAVPQPSPAAAPRRPATDVQGLAIYDDGGLARASAVSVDSLPGLPSGFAFGNVAFEIDEQNAENGDGNQLSIPLTLTYQLSDTDRQIAGGESSRIVLSVWSGNAWRGLPCSNDSINLSCTAPRHSLIAVVVAPARDSVLDWSVPDGHFFKQANGYGGAGSAGFLVVDDQDATFWSEFQRLGGVEHVGYPISQRFEYDGFLTQVFQRLALQWRPELQRAVPINVFDDLHARSADDWLEAHQQVPPAPDTSLDVGIGFDMLMNERLELLKPWEAMRDAYASTPDAVELFGLPVSSTDYGPVIAVRLQRTALQMWKDDTAWSAAGQAVAANAGDTAKEFGLWPQSALAPQEPPVPTPPPQELT